jgi:hypothetical protein
MYAKWTDWGSKIKISLSPVETIKFHLATNFRIDALKLASRDVDEIYPLHKLLSIIVAFEFLAHQTSPNLKFS